jgi:hypothetical protein
MSLRQRRAEDDSGVGGSRRGQVVLVLPIEAVQGIAASVAQLMWWREWLFAVSPLNEEVFER